MPSSHHGGTSMSRRVRRTSGLRLERLEDRLALCAPHVADNLVAPASLADWASRSSPAGESATVERTYSFAVDLAPSSGALTTFTGRVESAATASGLPILHSLPGAPTAIYLDFDGESPNAPYDVDDDPTTFNSTEAATIIEAWRQISVYFSIFDVDVTTVKPTVPFAWHLSSPSISGGYSFVGVFPNSTPQSFNNAEHARTRLTGIAHELGHNFGLWHQSDYDLLGNKTNEYSSGYDVLHGSIMGVDTAQSVHNWFIGHPSNSVSVLQDDIAVIAGTVKKYQAGAGDGFRADDHGGTIATARALAVAAGSRSISGIIERMADVDAFSFTTMGDAAVISAVPVTPSGVDLKVEVYDASGALVAASDGATNEQEIVLPAGTGTWYVFVSSHGDYGDVGAYQLSVNDLQAGWATADVGGTGTAGAAGYHSETGTFTVTGAGAGIGGTADSFRFVWQALTGDGSIVARVIPSQHGNASSKMGVGIRETLAAGSRHVALVATAADELQLVSRTSTGGSSGLATLAAAAFAPTWVRLVRMGNMITASGSMDGATWTAVGSVAVAMTSTVSIGLLVSSTDTTKPDEARFTDVSLSGAINVSEPANTLAAPLGVVVARGTGTALTVSWQPVPAASGYVIERSDDGIDFAAAGTAVGTAGDWTDTELVGSTRFFYRVRATDAAGRSAPSAIVSAANRPSAVTNAAVTSIGLSEVVLNWRDTSGDTGYRIERSSDNVSFTEIATVGTNVPSYAVGGLPPATQYWFRITPLSPFGDSVSTVVSGSTRLPVVGGLVFTAKASAGLAFKWSASTSATGYRIERSTDGGSFSTLAQVAGHVLAYTDSSVEPLGEYYYRVIATTTMTEGMNPLLPIFAAVPAASALPAPWSAADIGNPAGSGATGKTAGTFTIVAAGTDIWGTSDSFRFTSQTLVGDGAIVARVATSENTASRAKIGVMIRESIAANARHAMVVVTPSTGTMMQYRSDTGGSSASIAGPKDKVAPYWVRLVRSGNVFTGSVSADGTSWTQVGSVTISMAATVLVGLSANSNISSRLNTSTFDNVEVSNMAPTVAAVVLASPGSVSGRTTTVSVLGADDHGEANLSYAWAATGPATVTFLASGTNAAKTTLATFTRAGTYTLMATITDSSGLTTSSSRTVSVVATLAGISISPSAAEVPVGRTLQLLATCVDQFGDPLDVQPACTWSVSGGGAVSSTGLFSAPDGRGVSVITAAAEAVAGMAEAKIVAEERIAVPGGQTVVDSGGRVVPVTILKKGLGTLVLTGFNAVASGLIVEEGLVVIRDATAVSDWMVDVRAGGRLQLDFGITSVSWSSLALVAGAVVDLGSARVEIPPGGSDGADVRSWLASGRGDGDWTGGTGIVSMRAVGSGGMRTVGYRVEATGTTIAYAAPGDVNLDGIVDILDVVELMAVPFGDASSTASWASGDFNYDDVFDMLDVVEFQAADAYGRGWYLDVQRAAYHDQYP